MPAALHLGGAHEISLFHVSISVGILFQVWFRQLCCWGFMDTAFLSSIWETALQQISILPAFPPHCSLSPQLGMCYRCINWAGHSNITLDQFWFSVMVSICYKASLKMGLHLAVSMKVNMLECSKELYWFSKVATVDSPVRSIISLALRSCLHFWQQIWFPPAELALSAINYHQDMSVIIALLGHCYGLGAPYN